MNILGTNYPCTVVSVAKGESLSVYDSVGNTVKSVARITPNWGRTNLTFTKDAILVVEEIAFDYSEVRDVRFAQPLRQEETAYSLVTKWPRLRAALQELGIPRIHVPGGLEKASIYYGQMLVADYSMSGTHGWLINANDVNKYLKALPELKDSGEIGKVWINFSGYLNTPDECVIYPVDYDPSEERAARYWDSTLGYWETSNHQIFRIEFDLGSLRITRIMNQTTGQDVDSVGFQAQPMPRRTYVGERLPSSLRFQEIS